MIRVAGGWYRISLWNTWAEFRVGCSAVHCGVDLMTEEPKRRPETNPGDEAPPGTAGTGENVCRACKGTGTIDGKPCAECGGSGIIIAGIAGG
jgi:hypothetical protein